MPMKLNPITGKFDLISVFTDLGSISIGGAIGSGTNTRVLFNDGGFIGEDAGLTYNKTTDALTVAGYVQTSTGIGNGIAPILGSLTNYVSSNNITGVFSYNASAGANALVGYGFNNVTAGGNGYLAMSGSSYAGGGPFLSANSVAIYNASDTGGDINLQVANAIGKISFSTSNTPRWQVNVAGHLVGYVDNTYDIGTSGAIRPRNAFIGTSVQIGSAGLLYGVSANTLSLRNGTTAQSYEIYNTFTDVSNLESLRMLWFSNVAYIDTQQQGTGTARILNIGTSGAASFRVRTNSIDRWEVQSTTGHLLAVTDNSHDIGASGATRPRTIYAGTSVIAGSNISCSGFFQTTAGLFFTLTGGLRPMSDGVFRLEDNTATSFGRLQFGGSTSSYPSLKRSTTFLQARLADDSAFTNIQGKLTTDTNYTAGTVVETGYLTLYDATGTAYQVNAKAA